MGDVSRVGLVLVICSVTGRRRRIAWALSYYQ